MCKGRVYQKDPEAQIMATMFKSQCDWKRVEGEG